MKKIALMTLVALVSASVASASSMSIQLTPSTNTPTVGSTFTVTIALKSDQTVNGGGIATSSVILWTPAANAGINVAADPALTTKGLMTFADAFAAAGVPAQGSLKDTSGVTNALIPNTADGDIDVIGIGFAANGANKTLGAGSFANYCTVTLTADKVGTWDLTGQIRGGGNAYAQYYNNATKTSFTTVGSATIPITVLPVPEPLSLGLMILGLGLLRRKH